jgi:hypothetical protein
MHRHFLAAAAFAFLSLGGFSPALAQTTAPADRRLALVIGNDAYPSRPLQNAVNDARAITTALEGLHFRVQPVINGTYRDIGVGVDRFVAQLRKGDVALVYYAGHGMQIDGENFLVPVDFEFKDEADAKYATYSASRISERLTASGARLNILILDACRDNPFRATRSGSRGLAAMTGGRGSLIAFATGPGQVASDEGGGHGLFTSYLLQMLEEPGLTVEEVFSRTRTEVDRASNGRQLPYVMTSVIGTFYFRPPLANLRAAQEEEAAEKLWRSVKDAIVPELFELYLEHYPNGLAAPTARARLAELEEVSARWTEEAADKTFWEGIKDSTSVDVFDAYLKRFPSGAFVAEATKRRDALLKKRGGVLGS